MSFAINACTWVILSGQAIIWLARLFQTRRETNVHEDDRFACFESNETATNCFCSNTRLRLQLLPTRNKTRCQNTGIMQDALGYSSSRSNRKLVCVTRNHTGNTFRHENVITTPQGREIEILGTT